MIMFMITLVEWIRREREKKNEEIDFRIASVSDSSDLYSLKSQ